jgi:hypothetical protein
LKFQLLCSVSGAFATLAVVNATATRHRFSSSFFPSHFADQQSRVCQQVSVPASDFVARQAVREHVILLVRPFWDVMFVSSSLSWAVASKSQYLRCSRDWI